MSIQAQSECLPDILLSLICPLKWHKDVDETCKSRMFQEVDWNRFYSINAYHYCWGHDELTMLSLLHSVDGDEHVSSLI